MDAKFDQAEWTQGDGSKKALSWDEFWSLPLLDRVRGLSAGQFKFFMQGEPVRPKEAVAK